MSFQPIEISDDSDSSIDEESPQKKTKLISLLKSSYLTKNKLEMNQKVADFITELIKRNEEIVKPLKYIPKKKSTKKSDNDTIYIKPAEFITELIKKNETIVNENKHNLKTTKEKNCTTNLQKTNYNLNETSSNVMLADNDNNVHPEVNLEFIKVGSPDSIKSNDNFDNDSITVIEEPEIKGEIEIQCEIGTELYRDMKHLSNVYNDTSVIFKEVGIQCEMGYEVLRAFDC